MNHIFPGKPFSDLAVPNCIKIQNIRVSCGVLTAMKTVVPKGVAHRHKSIALFIPGFTGSKEDFYNLFPYLAELGWTVWAYSQRGQADSASPRGASSYSLVQEVKDALEIAKIISAETDCSDINLVGHSYGGLVAQAVVTATKARLKWASKESRVFQSISLMCSGPHGWPGRHDDIVKLLRTDSRDLWSISHPTVTNSDVPFLSSEQRLMRMRSMVTSKDELVAAASQLSDVHDFTFELRDVHIPTLVFHGQDDCVWPQEWQRREAQIVGGRYEVVPGAGHEPNNENPEATANLLDEFWKGFEP